MIAMTTFAGERVAVLGMARSGLAAAAALRAGGAEVACWDDGARGRAAAERAGLALVDLNTAELAPFSALVLSPGVPLTHPEPLPVIVVRARAANLPIIGDTELFFRELATVPEASRPKVVAITGTNGKSTTTALTAHLLRHAGKRVAMGGNIGEAVLGLAPFAEVDVYVLELSSYQIDLTPTLTPDVGILLNLTPDHLDRHGSMEHYAAVKERLVAGAKVAVVGVDDPWSRAIAMRRLAKGRKTFGIHVVKDVTRARNAVTRQDIDSFLEKEGSLVTADSNAEIRTSIGRPVSIMNLATLHGAHNAQNAAAALCACLELGLTAMGVEFFLTKFPGLAHRMEMIGWLWPTRIVNDSKATNADSTAKALASFDDNIAWILGGQAKAGGINALAQFFPRVRCAYLIGEASGMFAETLKVHNVNFVQCGTLSSAVTAAALDVQRSNIEIKSILLSPACASFDQFKDFEDRGDQFRRLVQALPGFVPYGTEVGG